MKTYKVILWTLILALFFTVASLSAQDTLNATKYVCPQEGEFQEIISANGTWQSSGDSAMFFIKYQRVEKPVNANYDYWLVEGQIQALSHQVTGFSNWKLTNLVGDVVYYESSGYAFSFPYSDGFSYRLTHDQDHGDGSGQSCLEIVSHPIVITGREEEQIELTPCCGFQRYNVLGQLVGRNDLINSNFYYR